LSPLVFFSILDFGGENGEAWVLTLVKEEILWSLDEEGLKSLEE